MKEVLDLFKFNEFTDKQILSLTDKQIREIITINIFQSGIKIVAKPTLKKVPELKEKKKKYYTHYFLSSIYFKTKEEVEEFIKLLEKANPVSKSGEFAENLPSYYKDEVDRVRLEMLYDIGLENEIRSKIKKINLINSENNKNIEAFNKYLNERNRIEQETLNKINSVKEKYARLNKLAELFYIEYVQTCKGDIEMATNFFRKANYVDDEEFEYVLKNYKRFIPKKDDSK